MDYRIKGNTLTITIDDDERRELAELKEDSDNFQSDRDMHDFLEPLVCNSELQWIDPADTGDLTDAPMLGITGDESTENKGPYGAVHIGFWDDKARYQPIIDRYAFMDYQLRSPLEDLLANGEVKFTK